jgi:outer membrane receptor for ferrienterochelin and colicins
MTLRAGYSTGFRAPQVFDEDLHITQVAGGGQIIKNDPNLAEENARSLTLGTEWNWIAGGATWMAESNLFHTRVSDSFVLEEDTSQSTGNESVLVRRNGSGSKIYGAEFNLGVAFGSALRFQLGYVEQRSRYDDAIEPLDGTRTTRIQRTPDRYGVLSADAALPVWDLRLFLGAKYTGPMEVPHAAPDPADIPADYPYEYIGENRIERSPAFFVFDLNLSREFEFASARSRHRDLIVRVGVKNLSDDRQEDFDQGEFRDSGYVYGPRFPRTFFVSTEINF